MDMLPARRNAIKLYVLAAALPLTVAGVGMFAVPGCQKPDIEELDVEVENLAEQPDDHLGKVVSVRGTVDRKLGTGAFALEDLDDASQEVVVIMDPAIDDPSRPTVGDLVEVTGRFEAVGHEIQPDVLDVFEDGEPLDMTGAISGIRVATLRNAS